MNVTLILKSALMILIKFRNAFECENKILLGFNFKKKYLWCGRGEGLRVKIINFYKMGWFTVLGWEKAILLDLNFGTIYSGVENGEFFNRLFICKQKKNCRNI